MKRHWTENELELLRQEYPRLLTADVASLLGRSVASVYNAALIHGIKKSAEFMASQQSGRLSVMTDAGRVHRFKSGHSTWNKGMKGLKIGGEETQFGAGHMPHNWRPIGSERLDRDGILWRKMTDTRSKRDWKAVHVMKWESVHGPLPADKFVVFADGNRTNFAPENLLAVTRAENMQRNTYHRYPKEIARLIQLRGAVNRQINKRVRHVQQD